MARKSRSSRNRKGSDRARKWVAELLTKLSQTPPPAATPFTEELRRQIASLSEVGAANCNEALETLNAEMAIAGKSQPAHAPPEKAGQTSFETRPQGRMPDEQKARAKQILALIDNFVRQQAVDIRPQPYRTFQAQVVTAWLKATTPTPPLWKPSERWRSVRSDESARDFLERAYLSKPFGQRPFTHQLRDEDQDLYKAISAMIANNKRFGRKGAAGGADAARSLGDLFPMIGSPHGGPKSQPTPSPEEALEIVAAQRQSRRRTSAPTKRKPAPK